jgi:hypothetical protein
MKKIFYKLTFIVFIFYWALTFLFVMPNNPINLGSQRASEIFHTNFFQRWAFFAPPPFYNQRVYIIFNNKISQKKEIFEILHPILEAKSQKAPFNTAQQIQDYIFSASLINTEANIRVLQDIFKNQNAKTTLKFPDSVVTEKVVTEVERTTDFKTLTNYSKIIAQNNGIKPEEFLFQIKILNIYMPQFIDRNSKKRKEEIMFSSHFLNF